MSTELKDAVANEALELSYLFRQNAALKNGLPDCRKSTITSQPVETPQTPVVESETVTKTSVTETTTESPSPGGGAAQSTQHSVLRRAAPFILTAAVGSGLPVAAYYALKPETKVEIQQPDNGSLLQALQDKGLHLPGGTWQTNPKN